MLYNGSSGCITRHVPLTMFEGYGSPDFILKYCTD